MSSNGLFAELQVYVDQLVIRHGVPALSVAVWHQGQTYQAAAGILNLDTGVEATVDSVFQIGSISKVLTASLVMLLVDAGKIELDRPIKSYLRSFHVSDPVATQTITSRHLLNHTSGLISDLSFGSDECEEGGDIARYVDRCFLLPQVHERIGTRFSYSNAAYVIAGRLIEVILGVPWNRAIEEYIFKPLNMTQSAARPAEVLRFRAAIGHLLNGSDENRTASVVSSCYLPLGMAPTGATLTMSAVDLLKFGRTHLRRGVTESGGRWLSEKSADIMTEKQVALPAPCMLLETGWGAGWALTDVQAAKAFGHGGGTIGQQALLEILPEHDFAFSAQLNGIQLGGAPALQQLLSDMLYEVCGERPKRMSELAARENVAGFAGRFGTTGWIFEIKEENGELFGRMELDGSTALAPQRFRLHPVAHNRFTAYTSTGQAMDDFTFLEPDQHNAPAYLFTGYRLHRRVRA